MTSLPDLSPAPLLYTTTEAAKLLSVTESYLKRGATSGVLKCTRLPGERRLIRWSPENLAAIIAAGQ